MLSYWEQNSFVHYEYIIVGSGIVGLHTALQLHHKYPKASILILEQGILPTGASTKNAGFACTGSLTELLSDVATDGIDNMLQLFEWRHKGLQHTRHLLGDTAIGYADNGLSYELLLNTPQELHQQVSNINNLLQPIINTTAFSINENIIAQSKFNKQHFVQAIHNHTEGSINTGLMMQALLQMVYSKGITIKTGCSVTAIDNNGTQAKLTVNAQQQSITFSTEQLILCTNAFTTQLLPQLDLEPGRGLVCITKPIQHLPFKGIFHFNEGYYYFRTINDRVLFGGGRQLNKAAEATTQFAINPQIQQDLINKLQQYILPHQNFEIDYWWTGIMAFGNSKTPIIQRINHNTCVAVRCGGMGVAIGPIIAQQCVALL
jgi:gamma-glutamylputrescine oxidase